MSKCIIIMSENESDIRDAYKALSLDCINCKYEYITLAEYPDNWTIVPFVSTDIISGKRTKLGDILDTPGEFHYSVNEYRFKNSQCPYNEEKFKDPRVVNSSKDTSDKLYFIKQGENIQISNNLEFISDIIADLKPGKDIKIKAVSKKDLEKIIVFD